MSFDFDAAVVAPFRMQPGLRRLREGARQLTPVVAPQRGVARHLREKFAVFASVPEQALCCQPGFDAHPALAALAAQGAREHPEAIGWDGERLEVHGLGWSATVGGEVRTLPDGGWPEIGPLLNAAPAKQRWMLLLSLAFEEDFAIVDARDARIAWLSVALPSGWAPEDKIGRSFAEVHAPVADNRLVVQAGPAMMRMVSGPDRWERFVWTISPHPRLHAHPRRVDPERWPASLDVPALVAQAWWRTEHQTFIPLPNQGQAVFTIRVDLQPLAAAIDTPRRAARLQAALASMSPAVLEYRGLADARHRLLDWLARRSAS